MDPECKEAARLALLVYPSNVHVWRKEFASTYNHRGTDMNIGVTATFDGTRFLVVRGTEFRSWRNIMTDLTAFPDDGYHNGFAEAAAPAVAFLYRLGECRGIRTIWTGHSLGGAVAGILSETIGRPGDRLITFGAPKWATRWSRPETTGIGQVRFVRRGDPVPHVPLILYSHREPATVLGPWVFGLRIGYHSMRTYRELVDKETKARAVSSPGRGS